MKTIKRSLVIALCAMVAANVAPAAVLVIGENTGNTSGFEDTRLDSTAATTNFASEVYFDVRRAGGDQMNGLIQFDISAVDASVNSATLSIKFVYSSSGYVLDVHRVLRVPTISQATNTVYTTGNSWTTAGADGTGTDREAAIIASYTVTGSEGSSYINIDVTAAVQDAVDASQTVCTLLIRRQGTDNNFASNPGIWASQGDDGARPYVTIDSDAGSASPLLKILQMSSLVPANDAVYAIPPMLARSR